jgi:hypothetical protein
MRKEIESVLKCLTTTTTTESSWRDGLAVVYQTYFCIKETKTVGRDAAKIYETCCYKQNSRENFLLYFSTAQNYKIVCFGV